MRARSLLVVPLLLPMALVDWAQVGERGPAEPSPERALAAPDLAFREPTAPGALPPSAGDGSLQETVRFEVYCGKPGSGYAKDYEPGLLNRITGDPDEPSPCLCEDPELPAGAACLGTARKKQIESWAAQVYPVLAGMGFRSPRPRRLGPVVKNAAGEEVVRLYADPAKTGYASTLAPCTGPGGVPDDRLALLTFNPGVFQSFPEPIVYRMLAHELVHVFQHAQAVGTEPATDRCPLPEWVLEGPADAVSVQLMKSVFGDYEPPLQVKGSRSIYGLRPWLWAFTWENFETVDRWGNALVPQYTASSFWTYLAERFHKGKFDYLASFYAIPDRAPGSDDWLRWLDGNLRTFLDRPLYLLFPDFIAYYASWGEERYGHLGEDVWLEESFGKGDDGKPCRSVLLSSTNRKGRVSVELDAISAQCVRVKVEGLLPGEEARVKFMTYAESQDSLDNLHLSLAYAKGPIVDLGRDFNCYREVSRGTLPADKFCFLDPFQGRRGGQSERGQDGPGSLARTWSGYVQAAPEGTLENLYLVSHVPVRPTDAEHAQGPQRGRRTAQRAELSVSVELTRLATTTEGEATTARADVKAPGGANLVFGAEGALSGVARFVDPNLVTQASETMDAAPGSGQLAGQGLRDFSIHQMKPGSEGGDPPELTINLSLLQRQIHFGSTGTYTAYVSGTTAAGGGLGAVARATFGRLVPGQSGQIVNIPPTDSIGSATVEVLEYSHDLLHLKASGKYCADYDFPAQRCRKPGEFQAEVVKPFGWTFDDAQRFVSLDSEGMAEYRKYNQELIPELFEAMPGLPGAPGQPSGAGGGAGAGGQAEGACACSCDEFKELQEKLQESAKQGGKAGPPAGAMRFMTCSMQCRPQYMACQQGG